jgi:CheY-like chemotaxis protein
MTKRVLIIDDEENIRRVTRLTLQAAGYEVGEAADGERGLDAFGNGSTWDAVLLDQRMPGMDGLETLLQLKQRNANACVIMATAYASIELAVDAMKLGATDFVRKPMTPEILRNALTAALRKSEFLRVPTTTEVAPEVGPAPRIETLTMNGFSILDEDDLPPQVANERRFTVRSPEGTEHEVVVRIDDEVVGYVERMINHRLLPASSFWTAQARSLLGDYLWNEGEVPPTGTLILNAIARDELPVAMRWENAS